MRRVTLTSLVALCLALTLGGCGTKKDLGKAEAAVVRFHQQLDTGSFDQIYLDSGPAMKNATSQEKLVALLDAIHRKLGPVQAAKRESFFVNYATTGEILRLNYSTQFESDKAAEEFIFRISGDDARLEGYHINSDALVTK